MQILHGNASTTYKIRVYIQNNKDKSTSALAKELHLSWKTVSRWRNRTTFEDKSCTPIRMNTTLSSLEEYIVCELRRTLFLSLDDLHYITKTHINEKASRSGIGRCIKRNGLSDLKQFLPIEEQTKKPIKKFKNYDPGYIHIDVKYLPKMPDEKKHGYLFVAIDRFSHWVYIAVLPQKSAKCAEAFLQKVIENFPGKINKLLTDNGTEFTDRFISKEKKATSNHKFDICCKEHEIEHRLTKAFTPKTNGMVERFNRRIAELLRRHRVDNAKELEKLLLNYSYSYNNIIKQRSIDWKTPVEMLYEKLGTTSDKVAGYYTLHPFEL